jgi:hypothetical protein
VAFIYGVATKRINEAVKNNPDKFPDGFVFVLDKEEEQILRSKFSTLEKQTPGQHSKYGTKAFTEKGLYMLATILKSPKATETTIAIIETYAKIKELTRVIESATEEINPDKQGDLITKSAQLISSILDDNLEMNGTETSIELNLAILKVKHTFKRNKKES